MGEDGFIGDTNLLGALFIIGTYIWDGIVSVSIERSCLNFIGDPLFYLDGFYIYVQSS